jgi:2',3'-cyclic-nucleotide 2'-phosphodiesterase (5'-nucleotidase family)
VQVTQPGTRHVRAALELVIVAAFAGLIAPGCSDPAPASVDAPAPKNQVLTPVAPLPGPAREMALPKQDAYPATVGHAVDDAIFRGLHAATTKLLSDLDPERTSLKGAPARPTETTTGKERGTVLRLWYTSNVHGEREDCGCKKNPLGGLTRKATLLHQKPESKVKPDTQLVLDAGDLLYQGPHLRRLIERDKDAAQQRAMAIIESFNAMGCDAFTPGEYDAVLGVEKLLALKKLSTFPWVSANMRRKGAKDLLFEPFVTRDVAGVKLVIVGVSNNTGNKPTYYDEGGFAVADPLESLRAQAVAIAALKPDAILLLSNLGIQGTSDLIKAVSSDVPVTMALVSGSNRSTFTPVWAAGDVPIFEAGHRGKNLGRVDVHVVDKAFKFAPTSSPWTTTVRDYAGAYRSLSNARKAVWKNRELKDDARRARIEKNRDRALKRLAKVQSGLPGRIERPEPSKATKSWLEPKIVPVKLAIVQDKKIRKIIDAREAKATKLQGKPGPVPKGPLKMIRKKAKKP